MTNVRIKETMEHREDKQKRDAGLCNMQMKTERDSVRHNREMMMKRVQNQDAHKTQGRVAAGGEYLFATRPLLLHTIHHGYGNAAPENSINKLQSFKVLCR